MPFLERSNMQRNFESASSGYAPEQIRIQGRGIQKIHRYLHPDRTIVKAPFPVTLSFVRGWLYLAIAFFMPFMPRFLAVIIGLSFVCWLAETIISKNRPRLQFTQSAYLFLGFYLIHIIGLFWSENLDYGFFDLQIKLSFAVFPLMLLTGKLPENAGWPLIARFFNIGCMSSVIIVLARAFLRFNELGPEAFFYKDLSWFLHPAYFSMYLGLSLSFILTRFVMFRTAKITALAALQVLVLTLTIMLLSSKAGIFVLLFIVILLVLYMLRTKPALRLNLLIASVFLIISTSLIFSKSIYGRLLEMKNSMAEASPSNTQESSAVRLMAWKVAAGVIAENPVFGAGTGDIKDELMKDYLSGGYEILYQHKVNSHNQFLQTMAALGIPGLLLLIGLILKMAIQALLKRDPLLMCFLILVFVNSMVESILEVQAGVIFFSFFYGVLDTGHRESKATGVSG